MPISTNPWETIAVKTICKEIFVIFYMTIIDKNNTNLSFSSLKGSFGILFDACLQNLRLALDIYKTRFEIFKLIL